MPPDEGLPVPLPQQLNPLNPSPAAARAGVDSVFFRKRFPACAGDPTVRGDLNVTLDAERGESDRDARPLDYDWVLDIREQCIRKQVNFEFRQCGTHFIKDGRQYKLQTRDLCRQARLAGINYNCEPRREKAL